MKKFPEDTLFEIDIKTSSTRYQIKDVSYNTALSLCEDILKNNPNDQKLQEKLKYCMNSFGTASYDDVNIKAYRKRINTGETHTCPRRIDCGLWATEKNLDEWNIVGDDRCCSFCGSLHPDRVVELIKQHGFGIVNLSDKNYKWYINQPNVPNASFGGIKYYRHHDTDEFIKELKQIAQD